MMKNIVHTLAFTEHDENMSRDALIQDHLERFGQMSFLFGNISPVVFVLAKLSRVSETCTAP